MALTDDLAALLPTPAATPTPQDPLTAYADATKRRRQLEAELDAVKQELKELEQQVLEEMSQRGMSSARVHGMTIYLRRELWARPAGDKAHAIAILRQHGMEDFIREGVSTQTLSAWVRELDRRGDPLPPELADVIQVDEVFKVGTRGG